VTNNNSGSKISNGGLTQRDMLLRILQGQDSINDRIDVLHEKVNQKMGRQELSGWLVALSAIGVLLNTLVN
tara:strand:+ start:822 stop:1034 length:213 start_codon:yes stop_codon:yes gene_type:complete